MSQTRIADSSSSNFIQASMLFAGVTFAREINSSLVLARLASVEFTLFLATTAALARRISIFPSRRLDIDPPAW